MFLYNKISVRSLCTGLSLPQLFFIYCSFVVLVLTRAYFRVVMNTFDIFSLFLSSSLSLSLSISLFLALSRLPLLFNTELTFQSYLSTLISFSSHSSITDFFLTFPTRTHSLRENFVSKRVSCVNFYA